MDRNDRVQLGRDRVDRRKGRMCLQVECGRRPNHAESQQASHPVQRSAPDEEHTQRQIEPAEEVVDNDLARRFREGGRAEHQSPHGLQESTARGRLTGGRRDCREHGCQRGRRAQPEQ